MVSDEYLEERQKVMKAAIETAIVKYEQETGMEVYEVNAIWDGHTSDFIYNIEDDLAYDVEERDFSCATDFNFEE